ncbi:MAG: HEAT repeat domain-containing protein, partial [Deltaproteobacteria bacterium]
MRQTQSPLALSPADRDRIAEVDRLARQGDDAVDALLSRLTDPSWPVRRAVVAALARLGDGAVTPLTRVLRGARDDETLLAAAVDALSASRGAAAAAMLDLLGSDVIPPVLCDAAQVLGRRRAVEAVPALEKLTAHPDDNLAVAAIEALGRIGGSAGIEGLIRVLLGRNFFRVFPAIEVLGRSGDPRVLEPLLTLFDNPRYAVEVARALGRTGAPAAAGPLARRLRRANDALTRAIAVALSTIHERTVDMLGTGEPVEKALQDGEDLLPAIQRLAESVPGATAEEQAALCAVLAWTREAVAATTLINLLDATPAAATPALRALGRESDPQLLQALEEGDSARRALLLPLVGTRTRSASGIVPCLSDPDPAVRILACNALARIGDVAAVPHLFELLREPDPLLSQAAVGAIQSLGSETTERLALAAARSAESHVRRSALRIVASFGYPAGLGVLIEAVEGPDDRLRDVAIHGLALMDQPRAVEVLLRTAAHPNPRARAAAMRALGLAATKPESVSCLRTGLSDADPWVRYYACQSLGKLGVTSAA